MGWRKGQIDTERRRRGGGKGRVVNRPPPQAYIYRGRHKGDEKYGECFTCCPIGRLTSQHMWAHCGVGWVLVQEQSHERADAGPGPSRAEPGQGPSLRGTASLAERGVLDCRQLLRAVLCGAVLLLNTKRSHRLIVSGPPPLTWMSPKGHVATLRVWPGAGARHRPAAADACGGRGDLERRIPRWQRALTQSTVCDASRGKWNDHIIHVMSMITLFSPK